MAYRQAFSVAMDSVDAVGIVFFAAYWNWYENTFEGLMAETSGQSWNELVTSGLALPVVHAEIDYLKALRLSDEVAVEMRISKLGSRSVHFEASFRDGSGALVATATTVNVLTSSNLGEVEMPVWLEGAQENVDAG